MLYNLTTLRVLVVSKCVWELFCYEIHDNLTYPLLGCTLGLTFPLSVQIPAVASCVISLNSRRQLNVRKKKRSKLRWYKVKIPLSRIQNLNRIVVYTADASCRDHKRIS